MPIRNNDMDQQLLSDEESRTIPYSVIDVGKERKKQSYLSIEEFEESLREQFSIKDFFNSDKPYNYLVEKSRAQPGLFDQYATVLKRVAHTTEEHDKHIAEMIESYRWTYIEILGEVDSILGYINKVEADTETADKVSVLPLMCGSGKSTAITLKIKEVIERSDKNGMLIVTDSNKRLDELWNENTKNPLLSDIRPYIKEHKKDVTILKRDTYDKAIRTANASPVLAMTTQRYFNVLTKGEIEQFLKWKDNGIRSLILFDEEPYLNEVCDLTPKTVNDIDTMLRMVLDEETVSKEDKQWCIRQWEKFREKFLGLLWSFEYDLEGDTFYYEDETHKLTEDDDRFFNIIGQCKTDIRADNVENYKNIIACKAFVDTWGIYS